MLLKKSEHLKGHSSLFSTSPFPNQCQCHSLTQEITFTNIPLNKIKLFKWSVGPAIQSRGWLLKSLLWNYGPQINSLSHESWFRLWCRWKQGDCFPVPMCHSCNLHTSFLRKGTLKVTGSYKHGAKGFSGAVESLHRNVELKGKVI